MTITKTRQKVRLKVVLITPNLCKKALFVVLLVGLWYNFFNKCLQ